LCLSSPRAAQPLGHHNLLATWLVVLLPLVVASASRQAGARWLAVLSGGLALAALLATRSLLGLLALLAQLALMVAVRPARRWWWLACGLLLLLPIAPRLRALAAGDDSSFLVRKALWRAAYAGALERPLGGWGPGSSAWMLSTTLDWQPGVLPPSEVFTDPHSLPLQLAFELGFAGLLSSAAVAVLFLRRRLRDRRHLDDRSALDAGLCGAAGFAVLSLGVSRVLSTPALLLALGTALGATLPAAVTPSRWSARVFRFYALVAMLIVAWRCVPFVLYDQAARQNGSIDRLHRAVVWDPEFPLYRTRLAWLLAEQDPRSAAAAREAHRAAVAARGLAPFWLGAGILGLDAGEPWARQDLLRACELDPFGALAPFFLMLENPAASTAPIFGGRALVAEPRLLAAREWQGHEELRARAVRVAASWPGIDAGWRQSFVTVAATDLPSDGEHRELALALDEQWSSSLSLLAFRRRPWPARLGVVVVEGRAAQAIALPGAVRLQSTQPWAFAVSDCGQPRPLSEVP
jgi:O-antigen ligase